MISKVICVFGYGDQFLVGGFPAGVDGQSYLVDRLPPGESFSDICRKGAWDYKGEEYGGATKTKVGRIGPVFEIKPMVSFGFPRG